MRNRGNEIVFKVFCLAKLGCHIVYSVTQLTDIIIDAISELTELVK